MSDAAESRTLSDEELIRQESLFGRLPLLLSEREYGAAGAHTTCFAYAVATWCFLVGGYAAQYLRAVEGVICLVAGGVLGTFLASIATAFACQRYGLEQMDYCKTAFGQRGMRILLVFYLINMLGWSGMILVMFGNGVRNILRALGYEAETWVVGVAVAVGIWLTYLLVTRGVHMLNRSNAIIGPGLGILSIAMFVLLLREHGWQAIATAEPLNPFDDQRLNYALVFELSVAGGITWWGGIGFLARNTRTRRNAIYPEMLQLGVSMSLVCCVSLFSGLVVRSDDPTEWMIPIGGLWMGVAALAFVGLANISSTAVSVYGSGLALRHLKVLRARPWWHVVIWCLVPCVPFVIWPTQLYALGSNFLAFSGTLYAPVCGVLLADYFFVRDQRLDIWAIFDDDPAAAYHYSSGFHWPAIVAILLGQVVYFQLLDPLTYETHRLFSVFSASLPACVLPGAAYVAWMRLVPRSKNRAPGNGGMASETTEPRRLRLPNL
jgi:NCS1 family nucleobase:cation symporter-1